MRYTVLLFTLFTSFSFLNAQHLTIKGFTTDGRVMGGAARLSDVTINVYDNNTLIDVYIADEKGKFNIDIDLNAYITLEFEKEGFFSKRIAFNTIHKELNLEKSYNPFKFEIMLLPYKKNHDYDYVDFPVTKIAYSIEEEDFNFVDKYTKYMKKKHKSLADDLADSR